MSEKKIASISYSPHWVHIILWLIILALAGWFIDAISPILLPFVLGAVIAYLFDPLTDRLERDMPRAVAALLVTFGFFAVLIALLVWLGPLLYTQLADLIAKVPEMIRQIEVLVRDMGASVFATLKDLSNGQGEEYLPSNVGELIQRGFELSGGVLLSLLASGGAVLNVLSLLLITPIVSFYLLRDWDKVVARFDKLLPRAYAPTIRELAQRVNTALGNYLRGQFYVMLILAVYYVIFLSLLDVKYALVLGVLAGLLVIVPYLGTWVSTGLALVVTYGEFGLGTTFWAVVAVFAAGQVLESQVLTPKVIGDKVGIHPLWMLFGVLAGGVLVGVIGVLLAVPITAVIGVLVKFAIERYLKSSLYREK